MTDTLSVREPHTLPDTMPDIEPDTVPDIDADMVPLRGNQSDYARYRRVSRQTISEQVSTGRIPVGEDGKIDFLAADAALAESADPARVPGSDQVQQDSFAAAKARAQRALAEKLEMDLEERKGNLRPIGEIVEAVTHAGKTIRRGLDDLPLMADEIDAAARDGGVDAVRTVLRKHVRDMEQRISDNLAKAIDGKS